MRDPLAFGLLEVAFGALPAWHCPRAARREYRAGIAVGRHGRYTRAARPIRLWTVIFFTALAGIMGAGTALAGVVTVLRAG